MIYYFLAVEESINMTPLELLVGLVSIIKKIHLVIVILVLNHSNNRLVVAYRCSCVSVTFDYINRAQFKT